NLGHHNHNGVGCTAEALVDESIVVAPHHLVVVVHENGLDGSGGGSGTGALALELHKLNDIVFEQPQRALRPQDHKLPADTKLVRTGFDCLDLAGQEERHRAVIV